MNKSKVETLACQVEVNQLMVDSLSNKQVEKFVDSKMFAELAKYMIDNMDKLPIRASKEKVEERESVKYRIKATLIDTDYLKKLEEAHRREMTFNIPVMRLNCDGFDKNKERALREEISALREERDKLNEKLKFHRVNADRLRTEVDVLLKSNIELKKTNKALARDIIAVSKNKFDEEFKEAVKEENVELTDIIKEAVDSIVRILDER